MPNIFVPRPLHEKLGDAASDGLLDMFTTLQNDQKNSVIELVGEKFERRLSEEMSRINQRISEEMSGINQRISEEIAGVNQRISSEVSSLRAELKEDNANLRAELSEKIAVSHANLIKWMFIFWIGQFVSMFGLLFVFLR